MFCKLFCSDALAHCHNDPPAVNGGRVVVLNYPRPAVTAGLGGHQNFTFIDTV